MAIHPRFVLPLLLLAAATSGCTTTNETTPFEVAPTPGGETRSSMQAATLPQPVVIQSDWLVEQRTATATGASMLRVGLVYSTRVDWSGFASEWLQYRWQEAQEVANRAIATTNFADPRFQTADGRRAWEQSLCQEFTCVLFPEVEGQPLARVTAIVWNIGPEN
jgi:hypothetical protein